MRQWIAIALAVTGLSIVGCAKDMDNHSSADACTHCPGIQKATADGKCPQCGMKVSMVTDDCCGACPGLQTASADGTCPACGKKPA